VEGRPGAPVTRRTARLLLTMAAGLTAGQHETLAGLAAAWTEMTVLAGLISSFAALLTPDLGKAGFLTRRRPLQR
jgi:hypothetical protein